jgi:hypothetical protein
MRTNELARTFQHVNWDSPRGLNIPRYMNCHPLLRAVSVLAKLKSLSSLRFQKVSSEQIVEKNCPHSEWQSEMEPLLEEDHLVATSKVQYIGDLHRWQKVVQEDLDGHVSQGRHRACSLLDVWRSGPIRIAWKPELAENIVWSKNELNADWSAGGLLDSKLVY